MTVRECYEKIGSDFDKVLGRMGSEALVKRFAVKFLEDKSCLLYTSDAADD